MDQKIQQWLAAPDASTNYRRALASRHPGTGSWLLDDDVFQQRLQGLPLQWLYGISGCGKTVLSATIIGDLVKRDRTTLYFFFDFQDTGKQTLNDMLRALIAQLFHSEVGCRAVLQERYSDAPASNDEHLSDCLSLMLVQCDEAYIVLDALDECTERQEVIDWLKELLGSERLHIIVTSRPEYDIQSAMQELVSEAAILAIVESRVHEDIEAYIRHEVRVGSRLQSWRNHPSVQDRIEQVLGEKAGGMCVRALCLINADTARFRWAACQLDALGQCVNLRMLDKSLNTLPKDLNDTYTRTLGGIPDDLKPDTTRVLQLLAYSNRPLTCEEVIDALAVEIEDEPMFSISMRMPDVRELALITSSLVAFTTVENYQIDAEHCFWNSSDEYSWSIASDENARRVFTAIQLAHLSVKEYLISAHIESTFAAQLVRSTARLTLSKVCLTYLINVDHDLDTATLCSMFPFVRYAGRHWPLHVKEAAVVDNSLHQMVCRLFTEQSAYQSFLASDDRFDEDCSPLCCAALLGFEYVATHLLERGSDVDEASAHYSGPLDAACGAGRVSMVKLLLDAGADPDIEAYPLPTVICQAAWDGEVEIVSLLINAGARIEPIDDGAASPLACAAVNGHTEVAKVLLDAGATVNTLDGSSHPALHNATRQGHLEFIELLLDAGADINLKDSEDGSALMVAAENGQLEAVKLLLKRGARVDSEALDLASQEGHDEIVDLLTGSSVKG